jgi:hypothetical protein
MEMKMGETMIGGEGFSFRGFSYYFLLPILFSYSDVIIRFWSSQEYRISRRHKKETCQEKENESTFELVPIPR